MPKGQFEYRIDPNSQGSEYFYVQPQTGVMSIARTLSEDDSNSYFLTLLATDKGIPSQTGRATVTVTVIRNANCPVFQSSNPPPTYQVTKSEL